MFLFFRRVPRQSSLAAKIYLHIHRLAQNGTLPAMMTLLCIACVYLMIPTRHYYWDGVAFALQIEDLSVSYINLFHSNHLIYSPFIRFLYSLINDSEYTVRAIYIMQAASSVASVFSGAVLYVILRRLQVSPPPSLCLGAVLLFSFSATWWKFSTDACSYTLSVLCVLCAYALLQRSSRIPLAALFHALAMLFHQLAVLFTPAALITIWMNGATGRRSRIHAASYLGIVLTLTLAPYIAAYAAQSPGQSFPAWVTSHSADSAFSFDAASNLHKSAVSSIRLFFGGKLSRFVPDAPSIVAAVCCLASLLALLLTGRRLHDGAPGVIHSRRDAMHDIIPHIVFVLIYFLFLFFWLPQNTFYRLFCLPSIIIIIIVIIVHMKHKYIMHLISLITFTMASWNFCTYIYPLSRVTENPPLQFALSQTPHWPDGTVILYDRFHADLWTISYFNRQAQWRETEDLKLSDIDLLRGEASRSGAAVWLEATAYDEIAGITGGKTWLSASVDHHAISRRVFGKIEFRYYKLKATEARGLKPLVARAPR